LFCIEAYENLLRFRTKQGLAKGNSGRYIDLASLTKGEKLRLKRSFKATKEIQELIQVRFKLSQLL
jgi:CBS domain-containing protein